MVVSAVTATRGHYRFDLGGGVRKPHIPINKFQTGTMDGMTFSRWAGNSETLTTEADQPQASGRARC